MVTGACIAEEVAESDIYEVTVSLKNGSSATISCFLGDPGTVRKRGATWIFTKYSKTKRALARMGKGGTRRFRRVLRLLKAGKDGCDLEAQAVFDEEGNTTVPGRVILNIPSGIIGNISRGESIADPLCEQCHGVKRNRTYTILESQLPIAPMNFAFSQQEIADIAAYLNRDR